MFPLFGICFSGRSIFSPFLARFLQPTSPLTSPTGPPSFHFPALSCPLSLFLLPLTNLSPLPPPLPCLSLHFFPCYFLPPFFFFSPLGGLFKSLTFPSFFLSSLFLEITRQKQQPLLICSTCTLRTYIQKVYRAILWTGRSSAHRPIFAFRPYTYYYYVDIKGISAEPEQQGGGEN